MSMFFETIKMSISNLWHNKLRTFLTVLGVVIGISSIIAMMTFIQGATDDVSSQLVSSGANKLSATVMGNPQKIGLTDNNINLLKEVDNVDYISVTISSRLTVSANENSEDFVQIYGTDQNYFKTSEDILGEGRLLYPLDVDNRTNVCIITPELSSALFGDMNPLGYEVTINGVSFTVVGILSSENPSIAFNKYVYIPYTTARETLNLGNISSFDVYLNDTDISTTTKEAIEDQLYIMFNEDEHAYMIMDMQVILDMFNNISSTMNGILIGIAAISLLVGGIGIMNMMLVSVSERTNEIGLRKSLGAKPNAILMQFVIEAVIISLIGGIIGLLLGVGISSLLGSIFGIPPTITVGIISLAVGFSACIGLIFGIVPAKRASKLNPIDALRSN